VIQELNERISSNSGQSLTEFSNDGKYLAALTPELKSNVFIYQDFSGKYKKIRLLEGRQLDLKFSPRSNLLYTFDMQQGKIREWNLKNNTVHSLHETKGDYSKLEIHPKKEIIAAAVETGSSQRPEIKLFEKTGAKYKLLQTIYPVNIGPTSRNTGGRVLDIKFTPDGKYLIAVGNESIIRIFYEMDGKYYLNQIVKSDLPMAHLEFLENGRYIAAANTGGQVTFYKMINSSLQ
ncbi:MAG: WD40 repeat domain-containing protein, partial [Spirochaetia bacterium]|nr:WD40 repeat domain-containing protein [Spirochaetia bacterium]